MSSESYDDLLIHASASLKSVGAGVGVVGRGSGRFLTATLGHRGVELYADDNSIMVDPAIGEELQGERGFETLAEALQFASAWLAGRS